jgi:tRNA U55 pseudouridine synthase TruB
MEVRPLNERVLIAESRSVDGQLDYAIELRPNYADSPALIGPRYQSKDMSMNICNNLGYDVSGLVLVGIRSAGSLLINRIRRQRLLREYEIDCRLGYATDNYTHDGSVVERSTYTHLTRSKVDYVLNKIQSTQQSIIYSGLNLKSQAAYEMAVKGTIKPSVQNLSPVLYSIRCVNFKPPDFKIRLVTLNENHLYLKSLVNGVGLDLRTNACVVNIRCTKYGPFNTQDHAILQKHWDVEHVMQSIYSLKELVEKTANPHRTTE